MTVRGKRNPTNAWIWRRKRGNGRNGYAIQWIDPDTGRTKTMACGTDLVFARARRDEKRLELRGLLTIAGSDKTLRDLKAAVPQFKTGKSPVTVRITQRSLGDLLRLCGDRLLTKIERGSIMEFRAKRLAEEVSPATVNKQLREIKGALSDAVDAGWIKTNPLWRWKAMQVREPEKRVRVVEEAEFEKIIAATALPELKALLIVAFYQGLRRTELCQLRWDAVDLERGILHVENRPEEGELTKSRKNRVVPMRQPVREVLSRLHGQTPKVVAGGNAKPKHPHVFCWDDGHAFKPDWVTRTFATIIGKADVAHCTLHDFRRSFSTLAQRAGIDRETVRDLGGWSTTTVVEKHYTGELPEVFERAVKTMDRAAGAA